MPAPSSINNRTTTQAKPAPSAKPEPPAKTTTQSKNDAGSFWNDPIGNTVGAVGVIATVLGRSVADVQREQSTQTVYDGTSFYTTSSQDPFGQKLANQATNYLCDVKPQSPKKK